MNYKVGDKIEHTFLTSTNHHWSREKSLLETSRIGHIIKIDNNVIIMKSNEGDTIAITDFDSIKKLSVMFPSEMV